jgi:hypothetical protein
MTTRKASSVSATLEALPVATIVHLLSALALAVVFVINGGQLPDDSAAFFGIMLGSNAILAVGRGHAVSQRRGNVQK